VTSVGSISLSLKEVRSSDVNAEMMSIVDFGDNMLLSFEDELPTSTTNINYTFQILFTDPVLKKFYINDDLQVFVVIIIFNRINYYKSNVCELFSSFDQLNVYYVDLLIVSKLNIKITNITAIMN
jgi:hypothetical protein